MEQQRFYGEVAKEGQLEAWDSCIYYNLDLMQQSLGLLDILIWATILLPLLLDILCYKYRHLAKYYIYLHILHLTFSRMVPNPQKDSFALQPV